MIGVDMGSIDIGPAYLGGGKMAPTRIGAKRDLRKVLRAARRLDIPLIVGSAGSAGARPHLDQTLDIMREIAREDGLAFRLAVVASDVPRAEVKQAIAAGRVRPMDTMPPLTEADVDAASHIVGQLGLEAFRRALEADVDVVVLGRACDTGIFASIPAMLGFPPGISMHMAKIIECASLCCVPGGRDTILGVLDDDGFELESMAPNRAATPSSVAAHSLYEQADPFEIREPSGRADLRHVSYRALDARRTRVEGATFEPAERLTLKLEGATMIGHRALLIAGAADPRFIARHEEIFAAVSRVVRDLVCEDAVEDYRSRFSPVRRRRRACMGRAAGANAARGVRHGRVHRAHTGARRGGDPDDQAISSASRLRGTSVDRRQSGVPVHAARGDDRRGLPLQRVPPDGRRRHGAPVSGRAGDGRAMTCRRRRR